MVEFTSAWKYISKDFGETLKFALLGLVMSLIPVVGPLVLSGLMVKALASVIKGKDSLPKVFSDFGTNLVTGLKVTIFGIILSIPILIVVGVLLGGNITAIMASATTGDSDAMIAVLLASSATIIPIIGLLCLLYAVIVPGLMCNFASENRFSALFSIGKVFSVVTKNIGGFVVMLLIQLVYSMGIGMIFSIIPIIGTMIAMPIIMLTSAKIMGTWWQENA